MSPNDINSINNLITKGGLQLVLVAIVITLTWLARWLLNQLISSKDSALASMREERDSWKVIALTTIRSGAKVVDIAEVQAGLK